ncbi:MAG: YjgN family protein, partial [Desulfobacterales bacterium]|nr:YjgN family protein [Desulfobacterales bacterium]
AFILWPILIPFTLGFIMPYVFFRQKKFVVENSAYGTSTFTFNATAKDYYDIALRFLFIFIVTGAIILIVTAILVFVSLFYPANTTGLKVLPIIPLILVPVVYLYSFAYFSVQSSNLLYNSGALRQHSFKATMSVNPFALIVLTNTLATVVTLGLFHPFAIVRAYQYKIQHVSLIPGGNLDEFVAAELKETNALGDELSDFLDFDFGL